MMQEVSVRRKVDTPALPTLLLRRPGGEHTSHRKNTCTVRAVSEESSCCVEPSALVCRVLRPEELQLQLCRTCHPSTRDLLDKALPSYADHCEQNSQLLFNMTPITGDEPALRLSPLHGGSWMTSASDEHHVGLTRCLDKHGPVTDAPKRGVCYGWLLGP